MVGVLNLHRGKIIAISGAVILHAAAFSAFAFAHLSGETAAFDGAPVISVTIANPSGTPPAATKSVPPVKAPLPTESMAEVAEASSGTSFISENAPSASPVEPHVEAPLLSGGEADAYAKEVWAHLASYRPRSVSGARQARIHFELDQSGGVVSVRLLTSSGSDAFDKACVQSVLRAAPFPSIPQSTSIQHRTFEIEIRAR